MEHRGFGGVIKVFYIQENGIIIQCSLYLTTEKICPNGSIASPKVMQCIKLYCIKTEFENKNNHTFPNFLWYYKCFNSFKLYLCNRIKRNLNDHPV